MDDAVDGTARRPEGLVYDSFVGVEALGEPDWIAAVEITEKLFVVGRNCYFAFVIVIPDVWFGKNFQLCGWDGFL